MKFARIIACLGWTGFVAGLVGFILMGALPMGQRVSRAAGAPAGFAHVHHDHGHAAHEHAQHAAHDHGDHEGFASAAIDPADAPLSSGGCLDACCGALCHALAGPVAMLARGGASG